MCKSSYKSWDTYGYLNTRVTSWVTRISGGWSVDSPLRGLISDSLASLAFRVLPRTWWIKALPDFCELSLQWGLQHSSLILGAENHVLSTFRAAFDLS